MVILKEILTTGRLPDKKVSIIMIDKPSSFLKKGHDGELLYSDAKVSWQIPKEGNYIKSILNDEQQQRFFEKKLFLTEGDMSVYKKGNYWELFRIILTKEPKVLDLSKVEHLLMYIALHYCHIVAKTWEERFDDPAYRWVIVDEDVKVKDEGKKINKTQEAYLFLGKVEGNTEAMIDFLTVYGKKPSKKVTKDWLKTQIGNLIEDQTEIEKVLSLCKDPLFEYKVLIGKAVEVKALFLEDKTTYRIGSKTGDVIGKNIQETIDYLRSPKNNEVYERIKNQIEVAK